MVATRKKKEADPWLSVGAAARAVGESRLAMLTRAVKGEVIAKHIGGRTFIRRDSLIALLPRVKGDTVAESA
jgi:hypothetical protein